MRRISLPFILSLTLLSPMPLSAQEEAPEPGQENASEPPVNAPANQQGEGQREQGQQAENAEERAEERTEEETGQGEPVAEAPAGEQNSRNPNEDFIPSIQISEDLSVAFPVDI